jgi:hypothetical protein
VVGHFDGLAEGVVGHFDGLAEGVVGHFDGPAEAVVGHFSELAKGMGRVAFKGGKDIFLFCFKKKKFRCAYYKHQSTIFSSLCHG